jgi:hypothetical protein
LKLNLMQSHLAGGGGLLSDIAKLR